MRREHRQGFTMLEGLIAVAILGMSFVVMFGYHGQSVRSNLHAHKMTDCVYLAQSQMEELMALDWTDTNRPVDLTDAAGPDPTTTDDPWAWLEHPNLGAEPAPIAASATGNPAYYLTWDIEDLDSTQRWTRMRVRCVYFDKTFNDYKGTTISSYKIRNG